MTEEIKEEIVHNYYYSVVHLRNGDVLIGPATIHTPVNGSTSIEDWIYTKFVVMSYPIRMHIEQLPDRYFIGFGKFAHFTNSPNVFLERKSIQSVNYASLKVKDFYIQAKEFLQKNVDVAIDRELDNYINVLRQKNNQNLNQNKDLSDNQVKSLFEYLMNEGNTNITIH